jgi:dimethylaniline monooxygenase (N-oxide forming)
VHFCNGEKFVDCDLIILCTGYKQEFPFFTNNFFKSFSHCAQSNMHQHAPQEYALPNEHLISYTGHPNIGFIGFIRPNVGAIPPMAEVQVCWWLQNMKKIRRQSEQNIGVFSSNIKTTKSFRPSYYLLGNKYQYGVDYGNYMQRGIEDFGAAPKLSTLWRRGFKYFFAYAQGQAFVPFVRLEGPYQSEKCWSIVEEEIYNVCIGRGLIENVGLAAMTLCFLG